MATKTKAVPADHLEDVGDDTAGGSDTAVSLWEVIKANPKVIAYSICVASGPLLFGYDILTVGIVTSLPSFQIEFGIPYGPIFIIPALWLGLWNAMLSLGGMVSAYLTGIVMKRYGRRLPFVTAGLMSVGAIFILYFSDRGPTLNAKRGLFLLGKIIMGATMSVQFAAAQTYVSEIAPFQLRGPLLGFFTMAIAVGQLLAVSVVLPRYAIFDPSGYRVAFLAEFAFSGLTIVLGCIIPESPVYLLQRNDNERALKAYKRLHRDADAAVGLLALQSALEEEKEVTQVSRAELGYRDCFKGSNWRRTRIIVWANILQQLMGMSLVSNAPYFFELVGMSSSLSLKITEVGTGVNILAALIASYCMTRFGRRVLMLTSTSMVGVMWLAIGIAGCFPHSNHALLFIGVMIIIVSFTATCGTNTIFAAVSAESSSVHLRAQSQGIAFVVFSFAQWLFSFCVPYLFTTDEANLGGKIGFIFSFFCSVALLLIFFEIPEMSGRTFVELDEMFVNKVPTREFSKYITTIQREGQAKGAPEVVAI